MFILSPILNIIRPSRISRQQLKKNQELLKQYQEYVALAKENYFCTVIQYGFVFFRMPKISGSALYSFYTERKVYTYYFTLMRNIYL